MGAGKDAQALKRPLVLALFAVMLILFAVLKFSQLAGSDLVSGTPPTGETPTVEELVNLIQPTNVGLSGTPEPELGVGELSGVEAGFPARDGELVRARVSKPSGNGPFPAVVVIHGAPSSELATDQLHQTLGDQLARDLRAVVVTVDWREAPYAEGDLTDLIAAVDWTGRLAETAEQPLFLIGVGHGGYLALRSLGETNAAGVVSVGGYAQPAEVFAHLQTVDTTDANAFLIQTGCDRSSNQLVCLDGYSILEQVSAEADLSMLLLQGSADRQVPPSETAALAAVLPKALVTQEVVTAGDQPVAHDFLSYQTAPGFTEGYDRIVSWIEEVHRNQAAGNLPTAEPLDSNTPAETSSASENAETPVETGETREPIVITPSEE